MKLLTLGNPKLQKGAKFGYMSAVLHLKPSASICPNASKGCMAGCLNLAGRGGMFRRGERTNNVQKARRRRTLHLINREESFLVELIQDMERLKKIAKAKRLKPALRLNGTSDVPWEQYHLHHVAEAMGIRLYDYTKDFERAGAQPYPLHFSRSESNDEQARAIMHNGSASVVVVSRSGDLGRVAEHFNVGMGWMVNGDEHDLRFLDPLGSLVVVKAKGPAIKDTSGFVLD